MPIPRAGAGAPGPTVTTAAPSNGCVPLNDRVTAAPLSFHGARHSYLAMWQTYGAGQSSALKHVREQ
jgi:hypothetical protein